MQNRVSTHPKIEILFNTNTLGLFGKELLEGALLVKYKGETREKKFDLVIDGFFLAIGHQPNSEVFKPFVSTDGNGYILTQAGTARTVLQGVFAAGDVADPIYRQAVTAAGAGCMAAIEVERYLNAQEKMERG
jgi:thioredoxin reductase (NADPH)